MMACIGDCYDLGPPPDMILSMPPPPLPSFLLPRSAIVSLTGNDSQPCFAAFMCDPSPGPREHSGIEFIELSHKNMGVEDTWLFVLISSCVGVLLLGAILAMILMKCRESYNYSYHDTTKPPMPVIGEPHLTPAKPHGSYLTGTMFYPSPNASHTLQQQLAHDNRVLWAALTPHGTRHFVTDPYQEDHYEVVDYSVGKPDPPAHHTINRTPVKSSFDNSGFVDYDYEDPTPLIESYHNNLDEIDMDSGYQEPQEVVGTLSRGSPRPHVSSPTRIEHPNIAPLNLYPHHRSTHNTLNKKSTLSRRISDVSTPYGGNV
ncbi:uncharacterized protein LOC129807910 [Phlebotomus papatasi]|uniref:Uncharacterized protein n=1 Tax=Phlebotomus papatasi TaxID=29031 RepID=A0A1B0DPX4_PHLPP|nr:uncharacterized protein LOC129807910 [Phlebotomus papatasi]